MTTIKDLVFEYLLKEGYRPTFDQDDDITFKVTGKTFWVITNDEDQSFFQLIMPHIYDITEDNRAMIIEVCNIINRKMKVVKAIIVDRQQSVLLSFEFLLDHDPQLEDLIPRALNILQDSYARFYDELDPR